MSSDSFVGIWTYTLTFNTTDAKESTVEVYMECTKKSETILQCRLAGDSQANATNYRILNAGTIELADDSQFKGSYVAEYDILVWRKNDILIEHIWSKQGITTMFLRGSLFWNKSGFVY